MNLRLEVSYDGGPFHGFARQPNLPTVQGQIEAALEKLLGSELLTACAGRTDAGVHALGQVMSVAGVPDDADPQKVAEILNSMLGSSIGINMASAASAEFNARFDARSRTYVYAILEGVPSDPFMVGTTLHHPEPLDLDAMNEAAGHLIGAHDFSSFGRVPEGAVAIRRLYELRCTREGRVVRIRARANAFIQQMVRSLVGTLIQIGEGKRSPDEMPGILQAKDRGAAGPVAPPHGLCLVSVEYDEGWSTPPTRV